MVLALVLVVVGAVYARVVITAQMAVAEAERCLADGRWDDALFHLDRAAHAYAPLNPYNEMAYERLWQLARKAELAGDTGKALQAYRSIRASILAARSTYTPHPEMLARANDRIARLMARLPPPPIDLEKPESQRMREHHALLSDNPMPDPMWSVLLILGLATWVGACVAFILLGLDRDLELRARPALAASGAFLAGLVLWVLGLLFA